MLMPTKITSNRSVWKVDSTSCGGLVAMSLLLQYFQSDCKASSRTGFVLGARIQIECFCYVFI